jgi:predicted protein tyrosine phosphatase
MYTRSEKQHRAQQLGMAYPVMDGYEIAEKERVNVLFVCSRNQWRSPTAERVFKRHPLMATRSAGTSPNARRTIREDDLRWADVVMVMEHKHRDRIAAAFPRLAEHLLIHVLDIPDDYREMDPELVELLEVIVPNLLLQA